MKIFFLYLLSFTISFIINGLALFVAWPWVMCACAENSVHGIMITFLTPLSAIVAVSVFHLLRKRFSKVKSCLMSVVLSFIIAILIFIVVMINVPALEKIFPSLDSLHGQTIKIPEINFATTTRATTSPVSPDNN